MGGEEPGTIPPSVRFSRLTMSEVSANPAPAKPYNSGVNSTLLTRLTMLFSFLGIFIAGVLSVEKLLGVDIPCGSGGGCAAVSNHPTGFWLGIPVAFYGFVGYVLLAYLASLRWLGSITNPSPVIKVGLVISGLGTLASGYLQYVALIQLGKTCEWCIASALTMTTVFVLHLLSLKSAKEPITVAPGASTFFGASFGTTLVALFLTSVMLQPNVPGVSVLDQGRLQGVELVPAGANQKGNPEAKVRIVEFADMCCPTCQRITPQVNELLTMYPDRVHIVFRHFPLPMHEFAPLAAAVSEYAGEKGKFWNFWSTFSEQMGGANPQTPDPILAAAAAVNLDVEDIKKRVGNAQDPIFQRVDRDARAAAALGIGQTPSFIVIAEGLPTRVASGGQLFQLLSRPEYTELLKGGK